MHLVEVLAGDDGAHVRPRVPVRRSHRHLIQRFPQRGQHAPGGLLHGHGHAAGHAPLPGASVYRADQGVHRKRGIRVGQDDHVVLGASGRLHALAMGGRGLVDVPGHGRRSDKGDGVDIRVRAHRVHHVHAAVDQVHHPGRQAGLMEQLHEPDGRQGHFLGRFEHEGVPADDGDGIHPHGHHGGEVEGRDTRADPHGLTDGVAVDPAGDLLEGIAHEQGRRSACELHDFDAPPHGSTGFFQGFAVFTRHQARQRLEVLFEQMHVPEQDPRAVDDGGRGPVRQRGPGGPDGRIDLGPAAHGRSRDDAAVRRIEYRFRRHVGRVGPVSIDKQGTGVHAVFSHRIPQ